MSNVPLRQRSPEALADMIRVMRHQHGDAAQVHRATKAELRSATKELKELRRAVRAFLARTDAIRDARGQEEKYLAREAQHEAFRQLRAAMDPENISENSKEQTHVEH